MRSERAKIELLVASVQRRVLQFEQHNRINALLAELINRNGLLALDLPVALEPSTEDDGAKEVSPTGSAESVPGHCRILAAIGFPE